MFGVVVSVLSAFTGLSVHGAVGVRYFQLQKEELAEYVGTCLGILLVSTSLIFLLMAIFGSWFSAASGVPADWLLVAVVLSGLQFIGNIRLTLWQVSGQAKQYGAFQISQSLINAGVSLILILLLGMTWKGRVLGQSAAAIIFGSIALWRLSRDRLVRLPLGWRAQTSNALRFGVPLIPHVIGGLLIVAADRFVIARLLDVAQAGIYMVALQLGQVLGLLTESFNKAYAPWLMSKLTNASEAFRVKIVRGTYLYFALILVVAIIFGLMAPLLLSVLVGEAFQAAGDLVIYIAVGLALAGCYYMVANYIFFESKTPVVALVTLGSGLINVILMFVLVGHNGILGAGQAFMVSHALMFLGTWWFAHKAHPMPWLKALRPSGFSKQLL